jgi:hypothetical protein
MADSSATPGVLNQSHMRPATRAVVTVRRELLPAGSATTPNHYQTLQISPYANFAAIRSAYRRLARQSHPDVNRSPEATLRMQSVNEAYTVLRDAGRKAAYDRGRFAQALQEAFTGATASSQVPAHRAPRSLFHLTALGLAALGLAGALWARDPRSLPAAPIDAPAPAIHVEAPAD